MKSMVLRWQNNYDKFKFKNNFIDFKNSYNFYTTCNDSISFTSMVIRQE